jgi:mono/diheme cytochrome c family protein
MGRTRGTCICVAVLCAGAALADDPPDYARDVQPIFASRCYSCHGSKAQMHGLRLDRKADALRGGNSGAPSIIPGDSTQSLLLKYVSGSDGDVIMPPAGERLKPAEIDILRRWIDSGALWPGDQETAAPKLRSNHWAFQPVAHPAVPPIASPWVRTPIDAFILQKLQARGWQPAPEVSSRVLLRRVYLDLTGLPPTLEEQDAFLRSPDHFNELVDDLLSRPAYGERWGRHWLDLVRFAETNGYERDAAKPQAWKYRDYVIRSFNHDKPFDRFIAEQLAGDELPDASEETFVALGYNRLGPWDDEPADPAEDRFDQLDDIVSTTSQTFLGLTLGCARCHNHKFEPLSARDYYSMMAIFDGLQRPRNGRQELDLPAGSWSALDQQRARDRQIDKLQSAITAIRERVRSNLLHSPDYPLDAKIAQSFLAEPAKRSEDQKKLVKDNTAALEAAVARALLPEQKDEIAQFEAGIATLRRIAPDLPRGYFLHEPASTPPPTHLLIRGKAASPGPEVQPAVPEVLVQHGLDFPASQRTSLRRLTFARWLAGRENPLTARVLVNRVWQHHFGEGLVRTPSDFGVMGEKPTHPELLDWLANWFMDNGWSIKKLHHLLLSSSAYRMSRTSRAEYAAADPENRLLWRTPYARLEVEAIRDSILAASGRLNRTMFGPSVYPHIPPAALEGSSDPDKIWKESSEQDASRRTIYVFLKRSMIVPMLEVLDLCDTARSSAKRLSTSVATQALTLFNGQFVNQQARSFAERLRREAGVDPAEQIRLAYRLALARLPEPEESAAMLAFVREEGLERMCRVIFNLNEFVYVD